MVFNIYYHYKMIHSSPLYNPTQVLHRMLWHKYTWGTHKTVIWAPGGDTDKERRQQAALKHFKKTWDPCTVTGDSTRTDINGFLKVLPWCGLWKTLIFQRDGIQCFQKKKQLKKEHSYRRRYMALNDRNLPSCFSSDAISLSLKVSAQKNHILPQRRLMRKEIEKAFSSYVELCHETTHQTLILIKYPGTLHWNLYLASQVQNPCLTLMN